MNHTALARYKVAGIDLPFEFTIMKPLFNFYGSLRTVAGWVWIAGTLFLSCQSAEKDATSQGGVS